MKNDKPKLSICICTYNRLAHLRLTIFRIIQELKGLAFEIVIIDGGSKDGTIEFLESNELKKKVNIVLIKQKKLIGATKSYVAGFEKSKFFFEKDLVYNPKNFESYLYLAKIYKNKENIEEEEYNLKNVLLLDPKNDEAIYLLIYCP